MYRNIVARECMHSHMFVLQNHCCCDNSHETEGDKQKDTAIAIIDVHIYVFLLLSATHTRVGVSRKEKLKLSIMGVASKNNCKKKLERCVFRLVHLWNYTLEWIHFLYVTCDIVGLQRNIEFSNYATHSHAYIFFCGAECVYKEGKGRYRQKLNVTL